MKRYWYIGIEKNKHTYESFYSNTEPTYDFFGHVYYAVIGPFRTKKAAKWAEKYGQNNPHFRHVNDAERLCRLT